MLNDWVTTKNSANSYEYQNHILTLDTFLEAPLHLIRSHYKKTSGTLGGGSWGITILNASGFAFLNL